MEEVLEVPDELLYQLMEQIESNNNHDTNNNDDVDAVENNSSNDTPTDNDLNTTSATRVVTIQRREEGRMIVDIEESPTGKRSRSDLTSVINGSLFGDDNSEVETNNDNDMNNSFENMNIDEDGGGTNDEDDVEIFSPVKKKGTSKRRQCKLHLSGCKNIVSKDYFNSVPKDRRNKLREQREVGDSGSWRTTYAVSLTMPFYIQYYIHIYTHTHTVNCKESYGWRARAVRPARFALSLLSPFCIFECL